MATVRLHPLIDANSVTGGLWIGSKPRRRLYNLCRLVDAVVFVNDEERPNPWLVPSVAVYWFPFNDRNMTIEDSEMASRAALTVRSALDAGRRVLVVCRMGLNRSGLVCALALMLPSNKNRVQVKGQVITPGCVSVARAVEAIRAARGPAALSNQSYIDFLIASSWICSDDE